MFDHIADAIKKPDLIKVGHNLYAVRFEILKLYSTLGAVNHLLESGRISYKHTLVDSSSGTYAYALDLTCYKYNMKCHIVAPKTLSKTLLYQLQSFGAEVEQVQSDAS